jgi:D-arginine dehydrogenase
MVVDVNEQFYIKPDAGRMMASPADESPSPPVDAQPEELDIAITVDRVESATVWQIRRLASRWAGLRSFAADRTIVCGPDPQLGGFFWLAGQGGYGVQTSPAMGMLACALLTGQALPAALAGVDPGDFAASRTSLR